MANFTLTWTPNVNSGVSYQQAEFRRKSVGGAFNSVGFLPSNPLANSVTTTTISGLLDNVVYEFRISNFCIEGRTYTSNVEDIKFACVTPTETHTDSTITTTVSSLPVDITKVRFTLFSSDGTTVLQGPVLVNTFTGTSVNTFSGLSASTNYIIKIELVAILNGNEVISSLNNCQIAVTTNTL